jgi:periplasmic protein TonB
MFEDSLFASGVSLDQRRNAGRTRWIAMASVAIQGLVLSAFIAVPLVWPERLPLIAMNPKLSSVSLKKPEVKVEPKPVRVEATDASYHAPSQAQPMTEARGGGIFHTHGVVYAGELEPSLGIGLHMGSTPGIGPIGTGPGNGPAVVAATPKPATLRISDGVTKGLLLAPIQPVYPRIAVISHVQGTVVVTATIDKHGRITGLQVVSGPEMLRTAAVDAIKDARYKPYLLNGEPTDIVTTISVNFRLGSQS